MIDQDRTLAQMEKLVYAPGQSRPDIALGWFAYHFPSEYDRVLTTLQAVNDDRRQRRRGEKSLSSTIMVEYEKGKPVPVSMSMDITHQIAKSIPGLNITPVNLSPEFRDITGVMTLSDSLISIIRNKQAPWTQYADELVDQRNIAQLNANVIKIPSPVDQSIDFLPDTPLSLYGKEYKFKGYAGEQKGNILYDVEDTETGEWKRLPYKQLANDMNVTDPEVNAQWQAEMDERSKEQELAKEKRRTGPELLVKPTITPGEEKIVPREKPSEPLPKLSPIIDQFLDNIAESGFKDVQLKYISEPSRSQQLPAVVVTLPDGKRQRVTFGNEERANTFLSELSTMQDPKERKEIPMFSRPRESEPSTTKELLNADEYARWLERQRRLDDIEHEKQKRELTRTGPTEPIVKKVRQAPSKSTPLPKFEEPEETPPQSLEEFKKQRKQDILKERAKPKPEQKEKEKVPPKSEEVTEPTKTIPSPELKDIKRPSEEEWDKMVMERVPKTEKELKRMKEQGVPMYKRPEQYIRAKPVPPIYTKPKKKGSVLKSIPLCYSFV